MITIHMPIELQPEVLEVMRARLEKHLYGKAKALPINLGTESAHSATPQQAGSAAPEKSDTLLCPDCEWLALDCAGPCATHRRTCESCGRGPDDGIALHAGDVSRTKLSAKAGPIIELWCADCDAITEDVTPDPDPWDMSAEEQAEGAIRLNSRELCNGESGFGSGCPSLKGDRAGYDEHDDRNDIEPFERTTSYPWGPK